MTRSSQKLEAPHYGFLRDSSLSLATADASSRCGTDKPVGRCCANYLGRSSCRGLDLARHAVDLAACTCPTHLLVTRAARSSDRNSVDGARLQSRPQGTPDARVAERPMKGQSAAGGFFAWGLHGNDAARCSTLSKAQSERSTERVFRKARENVSQPSRRWPRGQHLASPVPRSLCYRRVCVHLSTTRGAQCGSLLRPAQARPRALAVLGDHREPVLVEGQGRASVVRLLLALTHQGIVRHAAGDR